MKKSFLRALFFLLTFLYSIYASSQPKQEKDCSTTCFSSEVVSAEKLSETCTSYALRVSYNGACAHALSHFTVAVPCGTIDNIWNSQNWAQEIGTDPTTGLKGFKIDNTSNFGEGGIPDFTVKFTVCTSSDECSGQLACWQPIVAYKASTCVNYQTLTYSCNSLKASLQKQDVSCGDGEDGALKVIIDGGQQPYTIKWSDNSTGQTLTGLGAGTYSVIVRDASGAEVILEEAIQEPEAIAITGVTSAASCNGAADGSIDLSVSGGAGQYVFLWNNGSDSEDLEGLPSGLYNVTVSDEANCSASAAFTIENTSVIEVTGTTVSPDCNGSNGSIDISVAGDGEPYTFSWSNQATTEDLENISSGYYTVTVKDKNGCTQKASFPLDPDNTLSLDADITPSGCNNEAIGGIDLVVNGGAPPYRYAWSNQATTEDLDGLASGYYTVRVTDSKGCTINGGYAVSINTFEVPRLVVHPTCDGDADGSITLREPIGGTGPFTYDWLDSDETGTERTSLAPGVYSVKVTDDAGCSRTVSSTINDPSAISASAAISNAECNGEGTFSIDLEVIGGTAPYTFSWSDGSTSEDRSDLESGTYTVTITDDHLCSISKEIPVEGGMASFICTINEPSVLPVCGSQNNVLSTPVADADSYQWQVESTDGNWTIAGANTSEITYAAGGENSSATFTLTIEKDGCTQTCSYTVSSCTHDIDEGGGDPGEEIPGDGEPGGDNPGDEDPDGEDPGGDPDHPDSPNPGEDENGDGGTEGCDECFDTIATLVEVAGDCRTYELEVSTNGLCRHDLSHWTIATGCASVSNYWNSEGWKMELGKDPTTGLYGLKVDGINQFGKKEGSFAVRFTICSGPQCALSSWNPQVAYKAGQCVGFETVDITPKVNAASVSVYPNPFSNVVNFEWGGIPGSASLQIIDQYGTTLSTMTTQNSDVSSMVLDSSALPKGMYYYRLTIEGKAYSGKLSKR